MYHIHVLSSFLFSFPSAHPTLAKPFTPIPSPSHSPAIPFPHPPIPLTSAPIQLYKLQCVAVALCLIDMYALWPYISWNTVFSEDFKVVWKLLCCLWLSSWAKCRSPHWNSYYLMADNQVTEPRYAVLYIHPWNYMYTDIEKVVVQFKTIESNSH